MEDGQGRRPGVLPLLLALAHQLAQTLGHAQTLPLPPKLRDHETRGEQIHADLDITFQPEDDMKHTSIGEFRRPNEHARHISYFHRTHQHQHRRDVNIAVSKVGSPACATTKLTLPCVGAHRRPVHPYKQSGYMPTDLATGSTFHLPSPTPPQNLLLIPCEVFFLWRINAV